MLKVGIIGAGRMGKAHAGNLAKLKSVTLTAVYDIVPAQAAAMKELHPTMEIMDSAAALVNSPDVDLIVIASPTYCHKEGLLAAMATGKPIFCEKPLCRSKEDFKELAPMISSYKNLFAIGFCPPLLCRCDHHAQYACRRQDRQTHQLFCLLSLRRIQAGMGRLVHRL